MHIKTIQHKNLTYECCQEDISHHTANVLYTANVPCAANVPCTANGDVCGTLLHLCNREAADGGGFLGGVVTRVRKFVPP